MWCRKTNYKWLISSLVKVTWNFTNEASSHVRRWRDKKVAVETGFFFCLLKSARKKKCEGKKKGKNDRESVWDREGKLGAGSENEICRILKKCDEGWVWKPLRQPECHRLLLRALVGNHLTSQFGLPHIRKSKCGGGQKGQGVVRMVWSPSLCSGEEKRGEREGGAHLGVLFLSSCLTWRSAVLCSFLWICLLAAVVVRVLQQPPSDPPLLVLAAVAGDIKTWMETKESDGRVQCNIQIQITELLSLRKFSCF